MEPELKLVKTITKAALIEQSSLERRNKKHYKSIAYRKKLEEMGITANSLINPIFTHYVVDLNARPVYLKDFQSYDPNVRVTHGNFKIRYLPLPSKRLVSHYHYQIAQDLIHTSINVACYEHWIQYAKVLPELAWLQSWTTLCPELFQIAAQHPGVWFNFNIKYIEYDKHIKEIAKQEGREQEVQSVFINYVCSQQTFIEKYKDLKVFEEPKKSDIIDKIKEADAEYESTSEND